MKFLHKLAILCCALALFAAPAVCSVALASASSASAAATEQIDINSASSEQLQTLKGIGAARAAAIIKNRPYSNKSQLVSKGVIPQGVYDNIKDQIVARHSK